MDSRLRLRGDVDRGGDDMKGPRIIEYDRNGRIVDIWPEVRTASEFARQIDQAREINISDHSRDLKVDDVPFWAGLSYRIRKFLGRE